MNKPISLFISRSSTTSRINKTGSWRFARPRYQDQTAPCSAACPAGVDIPKIERAVAEGRVEQAWQTYMEENPFPSVCGRVCFHTCESACNRGRLDQPVNINRLDRFIGDAALERGCLEDRTALPSKGRRVAICGSGPAGLSAACFLTRLGFACEIFESRSRPGGVLYWGIPAYRLPKTVLQREIDRIVDLGVRIHCNQPVDADVLARLQSEYDAVFMGFGLGRSLGLDIPGGSRMADGLSLLEAIQNGDTPDVGGEVAVVGGGNTAVDVARSLVRLGVRPTILYRRRRQDMPAFEHEIVAAEAEGVRIVELVSPLAIEESADGVTVQLGRMKTADTGEDGRTRVVPDGDRTTSMTFTAIYAGIGADVAEAWHRPDSDSTSDRLILSQCTLDVGSTPLVYGGDPVMPVNSVTDAIASGKQAAIALHAFFEGGRDAVPTAMDRSRVGAGPALSMEIYLGGERRLRDRHVVTAEEINTDYFQTSSRTAPSQLSVDEARETFAEIESTLPADQAAEEAGRCYQCGLCNDCDNCRIFCSEVSIEVKDGKRRIDFDYCKGCGVCVVECPRCAMVIEEERA
ncbi:FAD-dependent oxidoreductase [uncultured Desulfosarcina sp.]|uniref:FAD-dependent oxidoreductase n=1 Tax=uncultured Desulfosarcina sp. TaxID=218289 RepID=UPI0029C9A128|nr:FAD-dependent oxidoreductase [uncultured Desulfosarcina sp.]